MREITYTQALMEAFTQEMRRDEKVFHLCGGLGPLAGLIPEFGESRVRVCPISEDAYEGASSGTDAAALVESVGGDIQMVDAGSANIKVTRPEDIPIAESILAARSDHG